MNKQIFFFIFLVVFSGKFEYAKSQSTALTRPDGWRYLSADMQGTNFYPYPSTVKTSNTLSRKFSVKPVNIGYFSTMLTGDVNNDGYLELIYVCGSEMEIYDHLGSVIYSTFSLLPGSYLSLLADVNGDGIPEIGVGSVNTNVLVINFYDVAGNVVKTFSKPTGGYDVGMWPQAVLPNGKLVVDNDAGYSLKPRGFSVFNIATGAESWYYDLGPAPGFESMSIADVNNNGVYSFLVPSHTVNNGAVGNGNNGVGTQTTDSNLWCVEVDENGNEVFSVEYQAPSEGTSCHTFVDLNGNGQYQILAKEGHDSWYPGTSQLHLFNANTGATLYTFDGGYNMNWSTTICDMNQDNKKEIIASNTDGSSYNSLYVLDDHLQTVESSNINGTVACSNDLNGDGFNEIVLIDESSLKILDHNLTLLTTLYFNSISSCIISDIDNDGINELFILADSLYCYAFTKNLGINENSSLSDKRIQIYPNPITSKATIKFDNPEHKKYKLSITDMLGIVVYSQDNIKVDKTELDKGNLKPGIYMVRIEGGNIIPEKLIVE